jgi:hypothetical protein
MNRKFMEVRDGMVVSDKKIGQPLFDVKDNLSMIPKQ